jgi:hypothetical protein
MWSTAMTRAITGKAEVELEYPEKLLIGTFDRADQFDARFDTGEVLLTLQRGADADGCRAMRLHLAPQVLADVLHGLAEAESTKLPTAGERQTLCVAAEALVQALADTPEAGMDESDEMTPDEEVLLLHVME